MPGGCPIYRGGLRPRLNSPNSTIFKYYGGPKVPVVARAIGTGVLRGPIGIGPPVVKYTGGPPSSSEVLIASKGGCPIYRGGLRPRINAPNSTIYKKIGV